jgi:hypothetical protein
VEPVLGIEPSGNPYQGLTAAMQRGRSGVDANRTRITGLRNQCPPVGRRPQALVQARSQQPVDFSTPAVSQQTLPLTWWRVRDSNPRSENAILVSSLWTNSPLGGSGYLRLP